MKIAHARSSEKGGRFGSAGDQTGKEVDITNYYSGKNLAVYRAKSQKVKNTIVKTMVNACKNNYIGYSQGKARYTMWEEAEKVNFDVSKIKVKCNTDCSQLVSTAINAAGIKVPKTMTTATMEKAIEKTGAFQTLKGEVKLQVGDIVRRTGHTFVVVEADADSSEHVKPKVKVDFAHEYSGSYSKIFTTNLKCNFRMGASVNRAVIKVLPEGTKLKCWGYYSKDVRGVKWFLCEDPSGQSGFISERVVSC